MTSPEFDAAAEFDRQVRNLSDVLARPDLAELVTPLKPIVASQDAPFLS